MNAISPPPANPAVGQVYGCWVWDGQMWVCNQASAIQVVTKVFTAAGTYMPSPGLVSLKVRCIGGGGGGGGVNGILTGAMSGGGGGSGGYSEKTLQASLVLGGVLVGIGAGGTAGGPTTVGGTGGDTTFGALCVAHGGGGGGPYAIGVQSAYRGFGGPVGIGDIAWPGAVGENGTYMPAPSPVTITIHGTSGGNIFGGNLASINEGPGQTPQAGANAYVNTGAGGGGGTVNQLVATANGGVGGSGICIVDEFCFADQVAAGPPCPPIQPCPPWGMARVPMTDDCGGWGGPWAMPAGSR